MQIRRKQKMKKTLFRLSNPDKHNDQKNRKNAAAQGNGTKSDAANASGLLFQPGYSLFRTLQFSKPDEAADKEFRRQGAIPGRRKAEACGYDIRNPQTISLYFVK